MTRRVLVTGAEGFVGGYLRTWLESAGFDVFSGTAAPDASISNSCAFNLCDAASVDALVKWAAPIDCVVHLAAITFVPDAARSPAHVMDVNLGGTIRLLDAVQRHAQEARVLFVGSSEAYGPPGSLPINESHPLNPANPYAISKAAADHYCAYAHVAAKLDIVRARPFNHSGPGQSDAFALSSFARQIAEMESRQREPVLFTGNLDVSRDFSHVTDVVDAYGKLLASGVAGEAYNVCSGTAIALKSIIQRLQKKSGTAFEVRADAGRVRSSEIPEIRGDHAKLTAATGWSPKRSLDDLLSELLEFWRRQPVR
jgi:GDP-4-dehydro-6-deoxy-D-mannose reductase